jgi:1-acyl-sn-glycerol-3-phosphate acyltransferase
VAPVAPPPPLNALGARARSGLRLARFAGVLAETSARWEVEKRWLDPAALERRKAELRHSVSGRILRAFGVELRTSGQLPPPTRARLVVANHRAALDIGILLHQVGGSFLSRADLEDWPVVGRLAREADTIFVDRDDRGSGARAIRAMRRHLKAGGSVMIFPEGATFEGDEVRPFKAGAFIAARGLDVEIVPVGLAYPPGAEYVDVSFVEHVEAIARRRRTPVGVALGTPFLAKGRSATLAKEAHATVQSLVADARTLARE